MATINKAGIVIGIVVFVLLLSLTAGFITTGNFPVQKTGQGTSIGEIRTVKLSSNKVGVYEPKEIRVRAGTKVRIEGDTETLVGGMDTVIIDGYNISKKISSGDNVIEFTAEKTGEFSMHCANQMGYGRLIVEA